MCYFPTQYPLPDAYTYKDTDTPALVEQINKASGLGIRVSFGFLSASSSYQESDVLAAIMHSGGQYSTVFSAATANSFVNLVLVNGLTTNDNPQGSQSQLVGGLSVSRFISGSETVTVTYDARDNEIIDFTVESIDADSLDVQALLNGKVVDETTTYYSSGTLVVTTGRAGKIEIKVKATSAPKDSIFTIGAISNLPTQNCTVGVGTGGGGLSTGGQAGLGIGLVALFGGLGAAGYFLWKHCYHPKSKAPTGDHGEPKVVSDQGPHDMPIDAKVDPQVHAFPLNSNPQPYYPPPHYPQPYYPPPQATMAVPPYMPPKQPAAPNGQNGTSDQPYQPNNSTGDQPPNSTSDQPYQPGNDNPTGDQPPNSSSDQPYQPNDSNPTSDPSNPPDQQPPDHDHDFSDFSDISSGSDTDSSHDKHKHKKPKRPKLRKDKCSCLQCPHCFDCGSLCSPDCSKTDTASSSDAGITGGRDCGIDCRLHCKHKDKYDCSAKKAHKKHRHRCHRCRAHNDGQGEGREEVCGCRDCEVCMDCGSDCGPGGCPLIGDELAAGKGHVHVRHRCAAHIVKPT
jgi:hypothetical protein